MNDLLTAIRQARSTLDPVIDAIERRSGEGPASREVLDRHQQTCFDLAWSAAELEAARQALDQESDDGGIRDRLTECFAAQALQRHRYRIEPHLAELGLDLSILEGLARAALPHLASQAKAELGGRILTEGPHFDDSSLGGHHRLLRDSYRRFGDEIVKPRAEEIHRQDQIVPDEIIRGLGDLGCFGLSIPQRYGGLMDESRPDTLSMLLATEELSRASLGAAGSLITRPEVLARALLAGGSEEQKAHWLPLLASGEKLSAVAVTEPDHGSDVASIQLRARRYDGGFRLSGTKMWTTMAGRADVLMVLARTSDDPASGHRGLSLFLVEKPPFFGHDFELTGDNAGSLRGRAIATLGYRGMHSYECFFDDWEVPAEALVGGDAGEGKGFYMTMAGFAGGRIQTAARAVGLMQAAFEEALEYCRHRQTFGRPIGDYPLLRCRLAEMAAQLHASRCFAYAVAKLMDRGAGDMEASMVKLFASRCAEQVTREAVQVHGGIGYAEESPVSRYFVDARVLSIFEGTEEILALKVVARSLFEGSRSH